MIVAGQNANTTSWLPIPNSNGLIVWGRQNPRILTMEFNGSDVVKMASEREQATFLFVIPNFDFVIVSTRNEQRLWPMETNASYGSYYLKAIQNHMKKSKKTQPSDFFKAFLYERMKCSKFEWFVNFKWFVEEEKKMIFVKKRFLCFWRIHSIEIYVASRLLPSCSSNFSTRVFNR